jgi:repressor LexA
MKEIALTKKQMEVLSFIRKCCRKSGQAPTYRDIANEFNIDVRAAYQRVQSLKKKGIIKAKERGGIELTTDYRPSQGIPILGSVPAGAPLDSEQWVDQYSAIFEDLNSGDVFALKARGDSMIDAGIFSEDLLLVKEDVCPPIGSVVIGAIDGEFTVKTLSKQNDQLYLCAENQNANYQPILLRGEHRILGRVLWSARKISERKAT